MVAYGKTLEEGREASPFPNAMFLDYSALKGRLYELEVYNLRGPVEENAMSLSVPPATNAAGMPVHPAVMEDDSDGDEFPAHVPSSGSHDDFLTALESELRKMDAFAHHEVVKVRKTLRELESTPPTDDKTYESQLQNVESDFLAVEAYVNLNVTGVRKLLKKHDKILPGRPVMGFFMAKMHDMRWIRNDYSDVVVRISRLYAARIAVDADKPRRDFNSEQNFVRATSKFWVRNEDLSTVKLTISRHLPVYLQELESGGEDKRKSAAKDSQLVNSVYLDNAALELYHGRLDKTPGAVALRLRWYGTGEPTLVFVERKTHREGWTGADSVKERFSIKPEQVPDLIHNKYDAEAHSAKSRASGKKTEDAIKDERQLIDEVITLIKTKHLVPTVRSQCTRVAFQLVHTNAVRVSMDSNLCLISEVSSATKNAERWYRDPGKSIPLNEITRFPFAVLEVKLALAEADELPDWVRQLVDSDKLIAVHKFSKFTHGCAVLMPDEVQAMPYWIDDPSIAASIKASGGESILKLMASNPHAPTEVMKAKTTRQQKIQRIFRANSDRFNGTQERREEEGCWTSDCDRSGEEFRSMATVCCNPLQHGELEGMNKLMPPQKIEPKLIFANERTLIHWLHTAVFLAVFGSGGLAASYTRGDAAKSPGSIARAQVYSVLLSLGAIFITAYALKVFSIRNEIILSAAATEWGDPVGPTIIGVVTASMLSLVWLVELVNYATVPAF